MTIDASIELSSWLKSCFISFMTEFSSTPVQPSLIIVELPLAVHAKGKCKKTSMKNVA